MVSITTERSIRKFGGVNTRWEAISQNEKGSAFVRNPFRWTKLGSTVLMSCSVCAVHACVSRRDRAVARSHSLTCIGTFGFYWLTSWAAWRMYVGGIEINEFEWWWWKAWQQTMQIELHLSAGGGWAEVRRGSLSLSLSLFNWQFVDVHLSLQNAVVRQENLHGVDTEESNTDPVAYSDTAYSDSRLEWHFEWNQNHY